MITIHPLLASDGSFCIGVRLFNKHDSSNNDFAGCEMGTVRLDNWTSHTGLVANLTAKTAGMWSLCGVGGPIDHQSIPGLESPSFPVA